MKYSIKIIDNFEGDKFATETEAVMAAVTLALDAGCEVIVYEILKKVRLIPQWVVEEVK